MIAEKMRRVNQNKPCSICGKCDWCLVAEDGSAAICARIENGSVKRCGDAGYLHILIDRHGSHRNRSQRSFAVRPNERPDRDFAALLEPYSRQITNQQLCDLSQRLGLSTQSLNRLRIGWDGEAYTFPMSDSKGRIIGVRRRFPNDSKLSIKGGRTGLFVPTGLDSNEPLLVCEGPTDTAAALDLSFDALGRPNCNSRIEMTAKAARGRREIVIVGDNDEVGRVGAEKLADALAIHYPSVKMIYPPNEAKDLRQWLQGGLTSRELHQFVERTPPLKMELR